LKKNYVCPNKSDITEGSIIEIYLDYKNQKKYEGRALLLEPMDSNVTESQRSYIRKEVGSADKQSPHAVIWTWERWKIKFIDGPNAGWTTARKISYFVAIDSYYESGA